LICAVRVFDKRYSLALRDWFPAGLLFFLFF